MALLMYSVIRRHMKQTEGFTVCNEEHPLPFAMDVGSELVVGWYINPEPWKSIRVIFTDCAIYVVDEVGVMRVGFDEMTAYELPPRRPNLRVCAYEPNTDFVSFASAEEAGLVVSLAMHSPWCRWYGRC